MTKSSTITLPTFSIGCERMTGRGYGILSSSGSLDGAGSLVADLPMVLLEWGNTQRKFESENKQPLEHDKKSFVLCLPLKDGRQVLMRGRYFKDGGLGPVAAINGVILDETALKTLDYRPERLLHDLPEPEDVSGNFGKQHWVGNIAPAPSERKRDVLSLGKYDWVVNNNSGARNESLLTEWLGRIADDERQRVQGFTTTNLPARGSIHPLHSANLAIMHEDRPLASHLYAVATASGEIIQKHGHDYGLDHKLGNMSQTLRQEAALAAEKIEAEAKAKAEKAAERARARAEKAAERPKLRRYRTPAGPKREPRGLQPDDFQIVGDRRFFAPSHIQVTAPEDHVDIVKHAFPEAVVEHTHGKAFTLRVPRPKDGSHVERLKNSIDKAVFDPVSGGKGFSK